jgi:hypothetical protein
MVLTRSTGTGFGSDHVVSGTANETGEYLKHRLAYAMAKPGSQPMFLDRENKNAGRCASVSEALASGRAFATELIDEIIPIDLDTDQPSVEDVRAYLAEQRIPYLACRSGGALSLGVSRHHVYLWVPDEGQRATLLPILSTWLEGGAVRYGQRMRPPGSPHSSGIGTSEPVNRQQARGFLEQLGSRERRLPRPLPPDVEQLLVDGPRTDRSTFDMKVIWRLVLLGYSDLEIIELAYSDRYPFSDKARGLGIGSRDSLRYLEKTIGRVRAKAVEGFFASRADVDSWLANALCWVDQAVPAFFGTTYTRRVFVACLRAFMDRHTTETALSSRSVASLAEVAKGTAGKHLEVLARGGWLLRVIPGRPGESADASVYRLNVPKIDPLLGHDGGVTLGMGQLPELPSNPIFMRGFLNESGRTVVNAMEPGDDMSRKELMEATGLSSSTLHDTLDRLREEQYLLIEKVGHGQYKRTDRTIGDLEYATEAEIVSSNRNDMFQQERHVYGRFLSERKRMTPKQQRDYVGPQTIQASPNGEWTAPLAQPVQQTTGTTT